MNCEFEPLNNFKVQVKLSNKYCKERQPGKKLRVKKILP